MALKKFTREEKLTPNRSDHLYNQMCVCVSTARTCTHPNAIKNVVWLLRILEK